MIEIIKQHSSKDIYIYFHKYPLRKTFIKILPALMENLKLETGLSPMKPRKKERKRSRKAHCNLQVVTAQLAVLIAKAQTENPKTKIK